MAVVRTLVVTCAITCSISCATPVLADGGVGDRHAAWRACLADAFTLRAALSSRPLAAETALRECRESEAAYLSALSASPLVDEDDVDRVRPALLVRARTWLLSGKTFPTPSAPRPTSTGARKTPDRANQPTTA